VSSAHLRAFTLSSQLGLMAQGSWGKEENKLGWVTEGSLAGV
jgi:hypothetical protein